MTTGQITGLGPVQGLSNTAIVLRENNGKIPTVMYKKVLLFKFKSLGLFLYNFNGADYVYSF
ncbi:MAG: hypothetical protein KHZ27_07715 [Fusobacterium sp.]|nr:hypothetical protein [Fusobacterium sp.]